MKLKAGMAALGLFLAASAWAADLDIDPFIGFQDSRDNALGGSHAALVNSFSSILSNPAALVATKPAFSAGRLDLALAGPIFDIASLLVSGESDIMSGIAGLLGEGNFYASADLSGPLSLGYMGDGLGFGIFQRSHFVLDAASLYSVDLGIAEDVLIVGGYGFRIKIGKSSALDLGILAKGYVRGELGFSGGLLELTPMLSDYTLLLDEPFYLTTGIGIDAGLRWNWKERIALGLVYRDAYSPALLTTYENVESFIAGGATSTTESGRIDPDLKFGLAFTPSLGRLGRIFDSLTIALDYDDILDLLAPLPRNAILNVDLGIEMRVLDILSLRIGIREALLQAGVDFDLDFAHVSVSAWGDELGSEPGQRPVYNLLLGIDFLY